MLLYIAFSLCLQCALFVLVQHVEVYSGTSPGKGAIGMIAGFH